MMRLILFVCLLALAAAKPQFRPGPVQPVGRQAPPVPILAYSNEVNYDGSYNYYYETGDGSMRQESGFVKNAGRGDGLESLSVQGSYSYVGPDGLTYTVTYIADENGFQPLGAHIPTAFQTPLQPDSGMYGAPGPAYAGGGFGGGFGGGGGYGGGFGGGFGGGGGYGGGGGGGGFGGGGGGYEGGGGGFGGGGGHGGGGAAPPVVPRIG